MGDKWEVKYFYLKEKSDIRITLAAIPITTFVYNEKLRLFVLEKTSNITFNTRRFVTFSEDAKDIEGAEYLSYVNSVLWIQRGKVYFTFEDLRHAGTAHVSEVEEQGKTPEEINELIRKNADGLALKTYAKNFDSLAPNEQAHIWRKASKGYRPQDVQAQRRVQARQHQQEDKEEPETHDEEIGTKE